jgi:cytosine/adenosine deaminase-related metal-dependent hydrolase
MNTLLVDGGTVVTQNAERSVIENGAVVVEDGTITAVGPSDSIAEDTAADRVVDASDHIVAPGFVDTHTHVSDILLRGRCGTDRGLYDWLFNVKQPGMSVMTAEDHELAAALYASEAIRGGITTVVENDAEVPIEDPEPIDRKLDVYEIAGFRNYYARGIRDLPTDDEFSALIERITAKEPSIDHPSQDRYIADIDDWIDHVETLFADYHGRDGRQEIWIAPVIVEGMTTEGLRASVEFARRHDIMTTTHVAEAPEQEVGALSSVEYLRNIGYLGEHTLLGHCVQVSDRDIRLLAETGTGVAHNIPSNLKLGNGFAPIPTMRSHGVTLGLGTDNSILSDTVNVLSDMRLTALAHSGHYRDPGTLRAQEVLDMATIEAARSLRKGDQLGSIEPGKHADLVLVDTTGPHMTPAPDPVSALVYQTLGSEVDVVVCDGEVILEDGRV